MSVFHAFGFGNRKSEIRYADGVGASSHSETEATRVMRMRGLLSLSNSRIQITAMLCLRVQGCHNRGPPDDPAMVELGRNLQVLPASLVSSSPISLLTIDDLG